MFRIFAFCTIFNIISSCNNSTKVETYAKQFDWKVKYKSPWEKLNDKFYKKYKSKIELSDIKSALEIIKQANLIDTTIPITSNSIPTFCYMSPTVQLERFQDHPVRQIPDSLNLLTSTDVEFILAQMHFLEAIYDFNWAKITNEADTLTTFPQYNISIPAFTCDKKKFVVCIEKFTAKNCMKGISYLVYKKNNLIKYHEFDWVESCETKTLK